MDKGVSERLEGPRITGMLEDEGLLEADWRDEFIDVDIPDPPGPLISLMATANFLTLLVSVASSGALLRKHPETRTDPTTDTGTVNFKLYDTTLVVTSNKWLRNCSRILVQIRFLRHMLSLSSHRLDCYTRDKHYANPPLSHHSSLRNVNHSCWLSTSTALFFIFQASLSSVSLLDSRIIDTLIKAIKTATEVSIIFNITLIIGRNRVLPTSKPFGKVWNQQLDFENCATSLS
ncbi:hypothetical protein GG344DRAFT_72966 [Lentinula edodes]|nr:hypothetical protein GG344DRAFT_72966 [Lentinula edodes]